MLPFDIVVNLIEQHLSALIIHIFKIRFQTKTQHMSKEKALINYLISIMFLKGFYFWRKHKCYTKN